MKSLGKKLISRFNRMAFGAKPKPLTIERKKQLDSMEYQLEQLIDMSSGIERIKFINDLHALRMKRTLYGW